MRTRHIRTFIFLAVAAIGCSRHDADDTSTGGRVVTAVSGVDLERRDSTQRLGPGDIRIVNEDNAVELTLVGDRITAGLSDQVVNKVRRELDTTGRNESGIGANIANMVKGAVANSIGSRVAFPLSDVKDVRYEDGRLVFEWKKEHRIFDQSKVNGKRTDESFRPDDARRFVDAVRARKRQLGDFQARYTGNSFGDTVSRLVRSPVTTRR